METTNGKNVCACCKCQIPPGQTKCAQCSQCNHKKVGFLLGLGILIFPLIFAWVTLRHGYSTLARVISFGWLVLTLLVFTFATPRYIDIYSMTIEPAPNVMMKNEKMMHDGAMAAEASSMMQDGMAHTEAMKSDIHMMPGESEAAMQEQSANMMQNNENMMNEHNNMMHNGNTMQTHENMAAGSESSTASSTTSAY